MNKNNTALDVNEALAHSQAFMIKYRKTLIAALVGVALVAGAWIGGCYYLKAQNEKGQAALALGLQYVAMQDWDKALKGDGAQFKGYEKIASEYSWTDAGNIAELYTGLSYFNKGDFKKAIEHLESFSPQSDMTVSPQGIAALANAYANEGKVEKAISLLQKAADKADNAALSPIYLLQAGQLLESQGKKAEAHEVYTAIKKDYPTAAIAAERPQGDYVVGAEIDKFIERTK